MREPSRVRSRPRLRMTVLCVLPARISSERIPRKPLRRIAGRPLVEWSWRAACRVEAFDEVWIATDSEEIVEAAAGFGGRAILTSQDHASGTDRVAEAAARPEARTHDVIVNFQADEPFLAPEPVTRTVAAVRDGGASIATLATPLRDLKAWRAESVVKVVRDARGNALYFSRAAIPHRRGAAPDLPDSGGRYLRHVGVYVFRRDALERWTELSPSPLEKVERLEQLRALEAGLSIRVVTGPPVEPGVDDPGDLRRAERILSSDTPPQPDESHV